MSSKLLHCSQDIVIKSLSKMMIPSDAVFWFIVIVMGREFLYWL